MKRNALLALLLTTLCVGTVITPNAEAQPATAQATPPEVTSEPDVQPYAYLEGEHALGDLGGLRPRLKAGGIDPFLFYTNNIAGNVTGGFDQGLTYVDDFYFGVKFDLEKMLGWTGGNFVISGVYRSGDSLTEEYVGSIYNSQQVFGGQDIFLYQFFLDQHFADDMVSLKIGRFGASDDFNASPLYGMYMNNGINGDIRNVLFNTQFSAYPFATWAARLRVDPSPEWNLQAGVFQTWEDIFDSDHNGLDWSIRDDDGLFFIAQIGWTPELFKRPVAVPAQHRSTDSKGGSKCVEVDTVMKGLPGHYWIGGTYTPWEGFTEFRSGQKVGDSYGFYVHADQMVYQEQPGSDEGLTLWAASGYYPQEEISIIPLQVNAGLVYKGLIPTRNDDKTVLGFIYGKFSDDYAAQQREEGNGDPSSEIVLEAAHRIQLTKFAYIQPDIQYIIRPGGTGDIDDAVVLGVQMGITF